MSAPVHPEWLPAQYTHVIFVDRFGTTVDQMKSFGQVLAIAVPDDRMPKGFVLVSAEGGSTESALSNLRRMFRT